jgi:hypothetical protein
MHPDRDLQLDREPPAAETDVEHDLGLAQLYEAMAGRDELLAAVVRQALADSLTDPAAITYRQDILRDCLTHPQVITDLYDLSIDPTARDRTIYRKPFKHSPDYLVYRAIPALRSLMGRLRRLRDTADQNAAGFTSSGFTRLFRMLHEELTDAFFAQIDAHLRQLEFRDGILISARLGASNRASDLTLLRPPSPGLIERIRPQVALTIKIPPRDEAGAFGLRELRERGLSLAADALSRSIDHIQSFFETLRAELGFYVGCVRLRRELAAKGQPICFPVPADLDRRAFSCAGLYDVVLSLTTTDPVVGNDVSADDRALIMVTGANQGGKSTFLRSVGLAQQMMQAGMFVPATSYAASVCRGVFTHFRRDEDTAMDHGRLDEELTRMSAIVDAISPGCLLLCNESFSSTNEREGSAIARQVIQALVDSEVRVVFVTHLFDLANSLWIRRADSVLFLRAQRGSDVGRTFRIVEGAPLPTSHGDDLFARIFGPDGDDPPLGPSSSRATTPAGPPDVGVRGSSAQ